MAEGFDGVDGAGDDVEGVVGEGVFVVWGEDALAADEEADVVDELYRCVC